MRLAKINNGFIENIETHDENSDIPNGYIDITNIYNTNIGDPIIDGFPVAKPSKWHTLNGSDWEITEENQTLKADKESDQERLSDISSAKQSSGLKKITIEQANNFIDSKIDPLDDPQTQINGIKDVLKKMIPFIINGG